MLSVFILFFDAIHNYCVAVCAAYLCCRYSDHYRWKKVTSCIYNLLGGQRWVDHYGEMVITNGNQCSCKLTFVKVIDHQQAETMDYL